MANAWVGEPEEPGFELAQDEMAHASCDGCNDLQARSPSQRFASPVAQICHIGLLVTDITT